jgi:hypothetical protein
MSVTPSKPAEPAVTTSPPPAAASTPLTPPGREPRSSIQKLLEEKKVGKILGFFETLSSSKKEPEPLEADTTKVPLLSLDHSAVSFLAEPASDLRACG